MKVPPDKTVTISFRSLPHPKPEDGWIARVTFPAGATEGDDLPILALDGAEKPIPSGVFEFAGQALTVKDGAASIPYATFIAGMNERGLWMHRPGGEPVPGGMVFE